MGTILSNMVGMSMDLNQLESFVEAVRAGSLSEAARRTGVPLATVSRQLRQLEASLSTRLVERGSRGIKTTPAGQRLFERAERGLELIAEGQRELLHAEGIAGRLRLSIPPAFEPWWTLLSGFRKAHPGVTLDVLVSERRIDLAADGVDVAIRIGEVTRASYVGRRLAVYRHVLVAAPALARRHRIEQPDDLLEVPCAGWRTGTDPPLAWSLGERVVEPAPIVVVNDYAQLRALALAGEAVTELPPFLAREAIAARRLVRILPALALPQVPITAVMPERRHTSALVRAYIDYCVEHAPALLEPRGKQAPRSG